MAHLQQAHAALGQQGFQIVGQPYSGGLQQGQTWNVPTELYPGYEYRVVGVCDRDCADLDLIVYDSAGTPFVQDTSTTSQPVVGIQTPYHGMFTIQAAECLGACGSAPMLEVSNGVYVHQLTPEKIDDLIESLRAGEVPEFTSVTLPQDEDEMDGNRRTDVEKTTTYETQPRGEHME